MLSHGWSRMVRHTVSLPISLWCLPQENENQGHMYFLNFRKICSAGMLFGANFFEIWTSLAHTPLRFWRSSARFKLVYLGPRESRLLNTRAQSQIVWCVGASQGSKLLFQAHEVSRFPRHDSCLAKPVCWKISTILVLSTMCPDYTIAKRKCAS